MNTCLENSKNAACPPDINETKNAKEFCGDVLKRAAEMKKTQGFISGLTSVLSPLSNFKTDAKTLQGVFSKIGITINQSQIADINNQCKVNTYSSQSNTINISDRECDKMFYDSIVNMKPEVQEKLRSDYISGKQKITVKNIDQRNANTIVSD